MFDDNPPTTQKEKLLQAAKAAGFWKYEYQNWPGMEIRYGYAEGLWVIPDKPEDGDEQPHGFYWNPLEDNEDSFLLMVKTNPDSAAVKELTETKTQSVRGLQSKAAAYREAIFEVICENASK